jgi:DNA-binding MarR family transcriptional regulator
LTFITIATAQQGQDQETDSDNDGMPDYWEQENGLDPENGTDADEDADGDGLTNAEEYNNGTNSTDPNNPDSDGGGVNDSIEKDSGYEPTNPADDGKVDSDNDGMPDVWEAEHDLAPDDSSDAYGDADGDGYNNKWEYDRNTDPNNPNSPEPAADKSEDGDEEKDSAMSMAGSSSICILIFVVPGIVILLVIIFFYTKMRRERLLEHRTRNRIYQYINKNPGTHYRAVMNDLDLHMGVLTHHINMLEQQRYIKSYQDGMYRRFYPIDFKIGSGLVLTEVQDKILREIQRSPGISQTGIAKNIGLNRKIVHYHVKLLSDAGFIHVETIGRETKINYVGGLDMDVTAGSDLLNA